MLVGAARVGRSRLRRLASPERSPKKVYGDESEKHGEGRRHLGIVRGRKSLKVGCV